VTLDPGRPRAASGDERVRGWAWNILAVVAGAAWGLCHGARSFAWAPWLALAPLFLMVAVGRRPFRVGFAHGLGAWAIALAWIVPTLTDFGGLSLPLALVALLLLAAYSAVYHGLFAMAVARLWRSRSAPGSSFAKRSARLSAVTAILGSGAFWVLLELVRAWMISGFPWNLAAYAVVDTPGALAVAPWVGAYGVSFVVVSANAALAWGIVTRSWKVPAVGLALVAALLAAGARFGGAESSAVRTPAVPVRAVQPNIRNLKAGEPWVAHEALAQYRELIEVSRQACDRPGALIVWPESAAFPFAFDRDEMLRADLASITALGCDVVLNSPRAEGDLYYNSGYLISAGRAPEFTDKRHLVPFGEYVPLRAAFPWLGKVARMSSDFSPATGIHLLDLERGDGSDPVVARLGMAICFEIIFPHEVAALSRAGATHLVTVTNDAWYGDTAAPWQHERAARFRAAENRRPVIRAAITGVSVLVDERGREIARLGPFEKGVLSADLAGRRDLSPYARWPWLTPIACAIVWLLAWGIARAGGIVRRT
jgi:apolipoprotein N-acyltransferase